MRKQMPSRGWTLSALLALSLSVVAVTGGGQSVPSSAGGKQAWLRQDGRTAVTLEEPLARHQQARPRPAYAPGHIVVKFEPELRLRDVRSIAGEAGATRVTRARYADFHYVEIPKGDDPVAAAARLRREPGVLYAEPDPIVRASWTPNDSFYQLQWNFQKINMERAWDINRGGSANITVAILDTGVAYRTQGAFAQAPDLANTRFVAGYDFIWADDLPFDTDGHGTHIAGTIAQNTDNQTGAAGMAFNVGIMPVKVLDTEWDEQNGAPFTATLSVVAQGIRWAADHGAKVINMSLGAESGSSTIENALRYAVGQGAFISIAAGNTGDEDNSPEWPATYAKTIDGVMAVAAVDYNLQRAPYSTHRDYVEIAAPGGDNGADANSDTRPDGILQQSFDPDFQEQGIFNRFAYMYYQGTSMSTAHVSALAALLMDQGVTSPAAVEAAIKRFAAQKPA
ncbi:MAG: peptidase S8, partial [Acidobacteria bacterium]